MAYEYVGPEKIARRVDGVAGRPVRSPADLEERLAERRGECDEPFAFVVDVAGTLLLAPRRSEHVACAGGRPVLAAGEIAFAADGGGRRAAAGITNQSTGYCPDAGCRPAVAAALDRARVPHPGGSRRFTEVRLPPLPVLRGAHPGEGRLLRVRVLRRRPPGVRGGPPGQRAARAASSRARAS
ncbi:hypothetical protein [Actinomadura keratinilytica]|uniref:Uncharacterized protein n=1 Tax=Actinomadura keratinilytica TaxID=547461 RepID=A0ABP7Z2V1_9ACTN